MAYDFQIFEGVVRLSFTGELRSADLMEIAEKISEIEARLAVTPHRMTDLSNLTGVDLNFQGMELFAERRRKAPLKNPVKSAIIAPTPLQYGFARMFQTLNDHPEIEIRIFDDTTAATRWLAGGPEK
jgi:hypothetical protein